MDNHCIILARGGSKGIPNKNIITFCGKPLIYWTIKQAKDSKIFKYIWVSSDSEKILKIVKRYGVRTIKRPKKFSTDNSSSEDAWEHSIKYIYNNNIKIDLVFSPQVTSPIRTKYDIIKSIKLFKKEKYDSMFSANIYSALTLWNEKNKNLRSLNYDYKKRTIRQKNDIQYIENGSFYIFLPSTILKYKNRFGKNIGYYKMEIWKLLEIDDHEQLELCKIIMKNYILKNVQ